jgi:hypothetical protein
MNRWRVGEDRGSKEMDGCPLTTSKIYSIAFKVLSVVFKTSTTVFGTVMKVTSPLSLSLFHIPVTIPALTDAEQTISNPFYLHYSRTSRHPYSDGPIQVSCSSYEPPQLTTLCKGNLTNLRRELHLSLAKGNPK